MTETGQGGPAVIDSGVEVPTGKRTSQVGKLLRATYVDRIGALYVLVLVIILFSVWKPGVFPTWDTARAILNANAITAMVSLALIVPLCAGMFDLSIGNVMALVSVMTAWLIVDEHVGILIAIVLVILAAIAVGVFNSLIAVRIGVDSFVATLGTGAVLQAINLLISGNQVVTDPQLNGTFSKIATTSVGGIQVTVFVALATMVAMWWLLEHTVTGRRLYATGFNPEGARLAGVRVRRIRFGAMIVSATVAGIAGLLITSNWERDLPKSGPATFSTPSPPPSSARPRSRKVASTPSAPCSPCSSSAPARPG
jgi:ribose transport system permease protein